MFYISLSSTKRKTLGEDLGRGGLKIGDTRPGLFGISLGYPGLQPRIRGRFGQRCRSGTWGAEVALGPVSPALAEGLLKPVPLRQCLFGSEDVCYRTS